MGFKGVLKHYDTCKCGAERTISQVGSGDIYVVRCWKCFKEEVVRK